ncbi:MAG: hypothetical protein ACK4N5_17455, partial [Myxococcales bacterium]
MKRLVLALPLLLSLSACEGSPPCTQCPNIAGEYLLTVPAMEAEKSSCKQLAVVGGTARVVVSQQQSEVKFDLNDIALKGTLFENLTVQLHSTTTVDFGGGFKGSIT